MWKMLHIIYIYYIYRHKPIYIQHNLYYYRPLEENYDTDSFDYLTRMLQVDYFMHCQIRCEDDHKFWVSMNLEDGCGLTEGTTYSVH